jgi:hypothetical protein
MAPVLKYSASFRNHLLMLKSGKKIPISLVADSEESEKQEFVPIM